MKMEHAFIRSAGYIKNDIGRQVSVEEGSDINKERHQALLSGCPQSLWCVISIKPTPDFEDRTKNVKHLINILYWLGGEIILDMLS